MNPIKNSPSESLESCVKSEIHSIPISKVKQSIRNVFSIDQEKINIKQWIEENFEEIKKHFWFMKMIEYYTFLTYNERNSGEK